VVSFTDSERKDIFKAGVTVLMVYFLALLLYLSILGTSAYKIYLYAISEGGLGMTTLGGIIVGIIGGFIAAAIITRVVIIIVGGFSMFIGYSLR
jgi:hypothetical protein